MEVRRTSTRGSGGRGEGVEPRVGVVRMEEASLLLRRGLRVGLVVGVGGGSWGTTWLSVTRHRAMVDDRAGAMGGVWKVNCVASCREMK